MGGTKSPKTAASPAVRRSPRKKEGSKEAASVTPDEVERRARKRLKNDGDEKPAAVRIVSGEGRFETPPKPPTAPPPAAEYTVSWLLAGAPVSRKDWKESLFLQKTSDGAYVKDLAYLSSDKLRSVRLQVRECCEMPASGNYRAVIETTRKKKKVWDRVIMVLPAANGPSLSNTVTMWKKWLDLQVAADTPVTLLLLTDQTKDTDHDDVQAAKETCRQNNLSSCYAVHLPEEDDDEDTSTTVVRSLVERDVENNPRGRSWWATIKTYVSTAFSITSNKDSKEPAQSVKRKRKDAVVSV